MVTPPVPWAEGELKNWKRLALRSGALEFLRAERHQECHGFPRSGQLLAQSTEHPAGLIQSLVPEHGTLVVLDVTELAHLIVDEVTQPLDGADQATELDGAGFYVGQDSFGHKCLRWVKGRRLAEGKSVDTFF